MLYRKRKAKSNFDDANKAKAACGLKLNEKLRTKKCLKCGKKFKSQSIGNRCCDPCRKENSIGADDIYSIHWL